MGVEAWFALGAVLVTAVSVFISWRSLRIAQRASTAADRSALAAEQQTEIQRQLRIDAAQPYVWADVRPDDAVGTLMNLVVGNSGPTVATNVRVTVDGRLPTIDQLDERIQEAVARLADGIQSIPPGRVLQWPLGQGFNVIKEQGRQAYTFTVHADGPLGPITPLSYVVDVSDLKGLLDRPAGSLHQLTEAVHKLTKRIAGSSADSGESRSPWVKR